MAINKLSRRFSKQRFGTKYLTPSDPLIFPFFVLCICMFAWRACSWICLELILELCRESLFASRLAMSDFSQPTLELSGRKKSVMVKIFYSLLVLIYDQFINYSVNFKIGVPTCKSTGKTCAKVIWGTSKKVLRKQ